MTHPLKLIRAELKARLLNRTAMGANLTTNRSNPVWKKELPAGVIYTRRVDREREAHSPLVYKCTALVAIEVFTVPAGEIPVDAKVDDLVEQIEDLLVPDLALGGLADVRSDQGHTEYATADEGHQIDGSARLNFELIYYQEFPEEPGPVQDFETLKATWDLAPPDGDLEAEDEIALP